MNPFLRVLLIFISPIIVLPRAVGAALWVFAATAVDGFRCLWTGEP